MNIASKNVIDVVQRCRELWEPPAPRSKALLKSALENQDTLAILAELEHWNEA